MNGGRLLQLKQIDDILKPMRNVGLPLRPVSGWLVAIREALGIPAAALGMRLGIRGSSLAKLERSEAADTITLGSLRRAAEALGCDLQYALVPKQSLESILQARAEQLAVEELSAITHQMSLEGQAPTEEGLIRLVAVRKAELLAGSWRKLWS